MIFVTDEENADFKWERNCNVSRTTMVFVAKFSKLGTFYSQIDTKSSMRYAFVNFLKKYRGIFRLHDWK